MKKLFTIILSLTIVITAFSSCTKEKKPVKETSTKPAPVETTTEKVVDSSTKRQMILISGIMDELLKSKYDNISFCITDLNQNGLLELLVTSYDIDSMKSDTAIYEVDEDFQSMITFSQSEDCEPDYVLFEGICYYDAVEDGYKYLNYDVSLKDNQRITDVYSVILIDGKIETTLIGSEIETMDDSGTTVFKDSKGEELSEDDYSELFTEQFGKAAEYYAQTGWKTYKKEEIGDFINEDPSEIYKVLEDSYKQFILEK